MSDPEATKLADVNLKESEIVNSGYNATVQKNCNYNRGGENLTLGSFVLALTHLDSLYRRYRLYQNRRTTFCTLDSHEPVDWRGWQSSITPSCN
ncbi:hypothetical protein M378DRAFT_389203 [Amanita muscaria Koide BX008]|uniref:Uncharacterized protein n=1 Tax=Amanita muscaria (strain Koide BX008) TaxID=946122 RepID=A0A0C2WXA0_AMAMK|nr:hypothetical protein M378DRAFT_389203 [Amanita muscaria Koide BX008]